MSINSDDVESVSVEILFENRKNTIFNVLYKQPKGQIEPFEKFWKEIFPRIKNSNKELHVAGDFNLSVLDHEMCKELQEFLKIISENFMINKPTRVTNKTATVTDHILEQFLTLYDTFSTTKNEDKNQRSTKSLDH